MVDFNMDLKPGVQVKDHKKRNKGRTIQLETRVDPQGNDIPPYWQVKNVDTGKVTTIREDQLVGKRWEQVN